MGTMRHALGGPAAAALLLVVSTTPALAQDPAHAAHQAAYPDLPEGWMARFDQAHAAHGAAGLEFVDMAPGWHLTTGPSGVFYRREFTADGSYRLESEIHLFDPGQRRESFGIFFGGRELHGDDQSYTYFLIRRTGEFMVRRREGDEVHTLEDWTAHAAILGWDDREEGAVSVRNVLGVEVGPETVVFEVNGVEVTRKPRSEMEVEGHFGLRVNHNLNLHVTRVEAIPAGP